ncbi:hypothetical protein A3770_13p69490 [Chloropicon primus]|uniref:Uncharacterized protein n=1 Tax=Chloropicon primus TaxID=1764295 RepID=A0A5B8MVQ3_9CHLO|nr:hypothetical protein A3770_13p69490 [Chloropicon primus]|eukprot:QDZ24431.1 hypothetical protein A3770_13p69490 [Chloropicon primus]
MKKNVEWLCVWLAVVVVVAAATPVYGQRWGRPHSYGRSKASTVGSSGIGIASETSKAEVDGSGTFMASAEADAGDTKAKVMAMTTDGAAQGSSTAP